MGAPRLLPDSQLLGGLLPDSQLLGGRVASGPRGGWALGWASSRPAAERWRHGRKSRSGPCRGARLGPEPTGAGPGGQAVGTLAAAGPQNMPNRRLGSTCQTKRISCRQGSQVLARVKRFGRWQAPAPQRASDCTEHKAPADRVADPSLRCTCVLH
jgi:hypothetical protein